MVLPKDSVLHVKRKSKEIIQDLLYIILLLIKKANFSIIELLNDSIYK